MTDIEDATRELAEFIRCVVRATLAQTSSPYPAAGHLSSAIEAIQHLDARRQATVVDKVIREIEGQYHPYDEIDYAVHRIIDGGVRAFIERSARDGFGASRESRGKEQIINGVTYLQEVRAELRKERAAQDG